MFVTGKIEAGDKIADLLEDIVDKLDEVLSQETEAPIVNISTPEQKPPVVTVTVPEFPSPPTPIVNVTAPRAVKPKVRFKVIRGDDGKIDYIDVIYL